MIVAESRSLSARPGECRRDHGYDGADPTFHCEKPTELAMPREKGKGSGRTILSLPGALRWETFAIPRPRPVSRNVRSERQGQIEQLDD